MTRAVCPLTAGATACQHMPRRRERHRGDGNAGAFVIVFSLASDTTRDGIVNEATKAPTPPDLTRPSMRSWLDRLEIGHGHDAAFETRMRWSPGGAIRTVEHGLHGAGYQPLAKGRRFVVKGKYGPLRDGELERARAELAQTLANGRP